MNAQTSNVVSSIAARYVNLTTEELYSLTSDAVQRRQTAGEIRSMAASLLRQDETQGPSQCNSQAVRSMKVAAILIFGAIVVGALLSAHQHKPFELLITPASMIVCNPQPTPELIRWHRSKETKA